MLELLARKWWVVLLRGVLAVAFGVLALVWPGLTLLSLVLLFGAYSVVDGVLDVALGIGSRELAGSSRWLLAVVGVIGIVAGVIAFTWPGITALVLLWVIAFWAVLTGIIEIVAAIRLRRELDNEWAWILSGVLSVVLGVLLILRPNQGALALVTVIGGFAIAWGVILMGLSLRVRRFAS